VPPQITSSSDSDYDVIVIGSGIGGLTAASLLSQLANQRVLLLEQHFKLGGFTHTFRRGPFSFDPGLHYVSDMRPHSDSRHFMDLVTGGQVAWQPMSSPFERFVYPDLSLDVPNDPAEYAEALMRAFPSEADAIGAYFHDLERASNWFTRHIAGQLLPSVAANLLDRWDASYALQTTQAYLERRFQDPRLRALLASQWPDYGLPPSRSSFAIHALVVHSYLHGGWYPVGGAGVIAAAVAPIIKAAGGACLTNHEVTEILLERDKARGVRVSVHRGARSSEEVFTAPLIISDAGAMTTYARLLPDLGLAQQRAIRQISPTGSTLAVYLGLADDPARIGATGANYWVYTSLNHDDAYDGGADLLLGHPHGCYLTFPSTRDPRATAHTAQIHAWVKPEQFASWADRPWLRRGQEYSDMKNQLADTLLAFADEKLPGLRELVTYREVSTPLSVAHFTGHRYGAIYGLPATPQRLRMARLGPKTPVRGLLLAGADVASLGIVGAMMGGVMATAAVLGPFGFKQIADAAQRSVR
jgi:phytoene dehydrogenase-like protein